MKEWEQVLSTLSYIHFHKGLNQAKDPLSHKRCNSTSLFWWNTLVKLLMPIKSSEEAERAAESGNWSSSRLPVLWNWYHWGHFGALWGTAVLAGKKKAMTPDMWHPQQPAKPRQATKNTMQNSTAGVMAEVRVAWDMMGWIGYGVPVLAFAKCSQFTNNYWGKLRRFGRMIYQKVLNSTLSYKWTKYRF